jgi:hypothetical protein
MNEDSDGASAKVNTALQSQPQPRLRIEQFSGVAHYTTSLLLAASTNNQITFSTMVSRTEIAAFQSPVSTMLPVALLLLTIISIPKQAIGDIRDNVRSQ